jgi:RimJ/RimL family protein N-acetyltransferase
VIFREATSQDLENLVDVQQEGAISGLANIFPQDSYPFPRKRVQRRWAEEMADPDTHVYVTTDEGGSITGFAATRGTELLHFGTSKQTWGTGLAQQLHDAVLHAYTQNSPPGVRQIRLRVFEANARARCFYEKLGWTQTGRRSRTTFPPHPTLLEYRRRLDK